MGSRASMESEENLVPTGVRTLEHPARREWLDRPKVSLFLTRNTVCPTRYRIRLAGGPLLRVATIRRTTDTHYRHTLQTHTTDTQYRHALQTRTTDTHYRHALQTHITDTFPFISHTTNVLLFEFRCNIFLLLVYVFLSLSMLQLSMYS